MRSPWLALLTACGGPVTFDTPIPDDGSLPEAPAAGEALAAYEEAAAWSSDHGGTVLLVLRGGAVVFEDVPPGVDPTAPVHLFSGTKSFACPLALALEAEGRLALDRPVTDALPDLAAGDGVTVRHLLDFSSGIGDRWWALTWDGLRARPRVDDKVALAASLPAEAPPGDRFAYGSQHLWVFSGVVEQAAGTSAFEALTDRVLDPIGLRVAGWIHDPAGHTALAYGAWTTAREWAKFGLLLLGDGVWDGARVLPEGAAARCFAASPANPAYGLTFWRNAELADDADLGGIRTLSDDGPILGADAPADLVAAAGANDQRLYLAPSLDLAVVRLGTGDRRFRDEELLRRVLAGAR